MEMNQAISKAKLIQDRITVHRWRIKEHIDIREAYERGTRSRRTAGRHGLSKRRHKDFIDLWFNYDLANALAEGKSPYCVQGKSGSTYTRQFKEDVVKDFVMENNTTGISEREFCKQQSVNRRSLQRYRLQNSSSPIKPYSYRAVPAYLAIATEIARLQYAEVNDNRDWRYCSASDEAFMDTNDCYNLLRGKLHHYCSSDKQNDIPIIQKTKWSGKRIGFSVLIDYDNSDGFFYRYIRVFETDPGDEIIEQGYNQLCDGTIPEEFPDWSPDPPTSDGNFNFVNRQWTKKYAKKKKKEKINDNTSTTVGAKAYIKTCVDMIDAWKEWKYNKIPAAKHKHIWHMHDNARYFISKAVQMEFIKKKIPIYARGDYYGKHCGFPAYSPDFNCVCEFAIAETKRIVAAKIIQSRRQNKWTADTLGMCVINAFNSIPDKSIQNWIEHMQRCITECIDVEGGYGLSARGLKYRRKNK